MPRFILILFVFIAFSCSRKEKADLIISNAIIYTADDSIKHVQSFAVKNGIIIGVGMNDEIMNEFYSDSMINATGKFIYPGLMDAHCHFYGYALSLRYADLKPAASFDTVVRIVQEHYQKHKTEWLIGRGWDQNKWPDKIFPDNRVLNKLFPDVPVVLIRIDGHAALANDCALNKAGFNTKTKISGGKLLTDKGLLTGILLDKACDSIRSFIPKPSKKEMVYLLKEAERNCLATGLTMLADAGLRTSEVELIDSLQQCGELKIKLYVMLDASDDNFTKFMDKGFYHTDLLKIASVKLYADGAMGSRGALLLQPYSDDKNNMGILAETKDRMREVMYKAYQCGFQVCTHAIGDSAVRLVLNLYAEILKEKNDRRWRIEHSQVVHPEDLSSYEKYSVIPAINTTHATSDMYWAEERLGKDRLKTAYAYQDLLKQNGWLCNGSDFPIENINPLYGFFAAVVRKDHNNFPDKGFQTENSLTREQAFYAMTKWAAKACFSETGMIKKGFPADFVIFEKDFMNESDNNFWQYLPDATYINGKNVFRKND